MIKKFLEEKLLVGELISLIGVLLLAAFLRLYRIGDYMTFLGDEGRDVLVAKNILEGDLVLLGPRSSAADFFYGPIYYYFITPFLWLFNYDPVGPAVFVALIGIATVYLVYRMGKELLGSSLAGLFAAALYSVSPLVISYSRSSWNPNPLPFVSLLALYLLYKAVSSKSWKLYLAVGVLLGIAMQLQYLALFLGTIVFLFIFLGNVYKAKRVDIPFLIKKYAVTFGGFLIGFSPFLAFEVRHGFPNLRTILTYIFTDDLSPHGGDTPPLLQTVIDVTYRLFGRLVTRFPPPEQVNINMHPNLYIWHIGTILVILASVILLFKVKNKLSLLLFSLWLSVGVGLFSFSKDSIYDYHFGFMFTLPFLLAGNALFQITQLKFLKKIAFSLAITSFGFLFLFNLAGHPFQYTPNMQKEQVRKIAEFVLSKTDNKPFNFALLTLGNSDHGYRYFFELHNRSPVEIENAEIDPARKSVTSQLLIVCEDPSCKPLGDPLWEVAGFGRAEIEGEWNVSVVKVYKMKHYKEPMGVCAPNKNC